VDISTKVTFSKILLIKKIFTVISCLYIERRSDNSKGFLFNIKKIYNALVYSEAIEKLITEKKIKAENIVLYSYWFYHWSLICALVKKRLPSLKAVSRAHLNDLYDEFHNNQFTETRLKYLDYVFPISEHGSRFLRNNYPSYASKIKTHYLGVNDLGVNKLIFDPNKFIVVSCSSVRKDKRIDKIVEVLSHVNFPITWIHFGSGPMLDEVKNLCKQLPANVTVEFKGYVLNHLVKEYYLNNQINLFLNFSSAEGIPVSVMEAISFGIPVMATSVYGTPEAVPDNVGELIDLDFDSKEVAKQITEFKVSYKNTNDFRLSVRKHWEENFHASVNYQLFVEELAK
jgi:glycosyltransferase involved in cell wall biosynthesis